MPRTMDEQLLRELDTLWQMALFLEGGDKARAEAFLARSVAAAIAEHGDPSALLEDDDVFERILVRRFLRESPPVPEGQPTGPAVAGVASEGLDLDILLEEAGRVPRRARAVLWLVLIRRRSPHFAAAVLGMEGARLDDLLRYRDTLMARILTRTAGRVREGRPRSGGAST